MKIVNCGRPLLPSHFMWKVEVADVIVQEYTAYFLQRVLSRFLRSYELAICQVINTS